MPVEEEEDVTDWPHIECVVPQAVSHSLMFLKMGKIIARNMSS
jgi:hypothetical protein